MGNLPLVEPSSPARHLRGLSAWAWMLIVFTAALPIMVHYVEFKQHQARQKWWTANSDRVHEAAKVRLDRAMKPLLKEWDRVHKTSFTAVVTPDDVDRILRPRGLVAWHSKGDPLTFAFTEPESRYTVHCRVGRGNFGWGGASSLQDRYLRRLPSREVRAALHTATNAALCLGIGLCVLAIALRLQNRLVIDAAIAVGLLVIGLRVASQIGASYSNWINGVDNYPWLAGVAIALWVFHKNLYANGDDQAASHFCPACEYDLTGNQSGVCPECGVSIPARILANVRPKEAQS